MDKKSFQLWVALNVLNLFDCITTYTAIEYFEARELNPIMGLFINFGWGYFLVAKIGMVWFLSRSLLAQNSFKSLRFCTAIYAFVVAYNLTKMLSLYING